MSTNGMSAEDAAAYAWFIKCKNDFLLNAQHGEHNFLAAFDGLLKRFRAHAQGDRADLIAMAAMILGGMADGRQTIHDSAVREAARAARRLMTQIDEEVPDVEG